MGSTAIHNLQNIACPCGSGKMYSSCCGEFHHGNKLPETAEKLMRSRYTAFSLNNLSYIQDTMQGNAAKKFSEPETNEDQSSHELLGLDVTRQYIDKKNPHHAFVEFRVLHQFEKKFDVTQELSEFSRINGKWFYVDGKTQKSSRNDPCPCHSGKKFKKCHGIDN